jgi:hypothetical protein
VKTVPLVMILATVIAGPAGAQTERDYSGQGYAFFAPGVTSPDGSGFVHYGAGAEGFVYKGVSAGAEVGYAHPWRGFREGLGVFSADGGYFFRNARSASAKFVPFVNGGYTLLFRSGSESGFNVGGGVISWFSERVGLRLEVRDHAFSDGGRLAHLVGFRIGLAFR